MMKFKLFSFITSNLHRCCNKWLLVLVFTFAVFLVNAQAPVISYVTPQTYTQNITITPLAPSNTGGAVPATIYGQVTTFAGSGAAGSVDGQGTAASFTSPYGIAIDNSANIYVADYGDQLIRKILPAGLVSTYAGTGSPGLANGLANAATFNFPGGVAVDASGNIYIGDQTNNVVRAISTGGVVSTYAGSGIAGAANGPATTATFSGPAGLAFDAFGNLYVADRINNLIRKITPAGVVSTLAGNGVPGFGNGTGTAAGFNNCTGIAVDMANNLYVTDQFNNRIRKITPAGVVTTYAGTGGQGNANGTTVSATFNQPFGLTVSIDGTVYVADEFNNLVRAISPTGLVTTLAGNGVQSSVDGIGTGASFNYPSGAALDGLGNLFVNDVTGNKIRKIVVTGYTIDKALPTGMSFDPKTGIISGTPTVTSPPTDYTVTAYNVYGSSVTRVNIQVVLSTLKPSIITFPIAKPPIDQNDNFNPGATSTNPETPITYTSSNTNIAIINPDGTVKVVGLGTVTITANQVGDANFSPAVPTKKPYTFTLDQAISFPTINASSICTADFSTNASSSDANTLFNFSDPIPPLTFNSSNLAVATISATGIIHITGIGSTTITVSQAGNNSFNAAQPQSQVLNVVSPSPPNVSITADAQSTCVGYPINFTAVVTNVPVGANLSYQWQVNGVNTGANRATFTSTTLNAASTVQCTVIYNGTCGPLSGVSNTISGLLITPFTTPSVTITSSQTVPVCSGSAITFTAIPVNGGTTPIYQWQVNGQNNGTNSPTFSANNFANGDVVTCMLTNTGGKCLAALTANSNAILVSIITPANPGPSVSIISSANGVYFGMPITFTATTANTGNAIDYQWQVNGKNAGTNSPTFISSNLNNADVVTCIVFISTGCIPTIVSNGITASILPPPVVTVINTFTPNGDGVNDLWDIPDLSAYPNCLVSVYTRYGSLVFQSHGYPIPWDGNYKGKPLSAGTYYYVINLGYNTAKLSGFVAIIK